MSTATKNGRTKKGWAPQAPKDKAEVEEKVTVDVWWPELVSAAAGLRRMLEACGENISALENALHDPAENGRGTTYVSYSLDDLYEVAHMMAARAGRLSHEVGEERLLAQWRLRRKNRDELLKE